MKTLPSRTALFTLFAVASSLFLTSPSSAAPASPDAANTAVALPSLASAAPLGLRSARLNNPVVPRYGKVELTLDLSATYTNPFDPDQIDVEAEFISPHGRKVTIYGFLDQPFQRRLQNGSEMVEPTGPPVWKVRFAPDETGVWHTLVRARDRSGQVVLPEGQFRVTSSDNPGFIRRSKRNPLVFAFNDEKPYFPVGENMAWAGRGGTYDYDRWLEKLGNAGGDWVRVWMNTWNVGLEWTPDPKAAPGSPVSYYRGLGEYNLANAWRLDQILNTASRNGVRVMLTLGTYSEFTTGGYFHEGLWERNPYNAASGGPCADPKAFWTNETARRLYRQRLRYIAARYGWDPTVQAWEFWNETDAPAPWMGEMSRAMRGEGEFASFPPLDPYSHLLTTTYGTPEVWRLPEIDFTQTHSYGTGNIHDHAPVVHDDAQMAWKFEKPHLMGEFGIDWRGSDAKYDPIGAAVNLHNGIWAATTSGDAGSAMLWWWDNYIDPQNLYSAFTGLRRFVDRIDWTAGPWEPLAIQATRTLNGPDQFGPLTIPTAGGWGKASATDFTITPLGVTGHAVAPQYLYSPGKPELRTVPSFHVHLSQPAQFIVNVGTVSSDIDVQVKVDGQIARSIKLSASPPTDGSAPLYHSNHYRPEWKSYEADFDRDYTVDLPPGDHTIALDAASGDWVTINQITLTNFRSMRYVDLNAYGLRHGREAILWLQNPASNWQNVYEKKTIEPIRNLDLTLSGLRRGHYRVEWWDTRSGSVIRTEKVRADRQGIHLSLPELTTDVAARVTPG